NDQERAAEAASLARGQMLLTNADMESGRLAYGQGHQHIDEQREGGQDVERGIVPLVALLQHGPICTSIAPDAAVGKGGVLLHHEDVTLSPEAAPGFRGGQGLAASDAPGRTFPVVEAADTTSHTRHDYLTKVDCARSERRR